MPFDPYQPDAQDSEEGCDLFILRETLSHLRSPDAWTKGTLHAPGDRHCLVGWLYALTGDDPEPVRRIVRNYLIPTLPALLRLRWRGSEPEHVLFHYNDRYGYEKVVTLLERTIARTEKPLAYSWAL